MRTVPVAVAPLQGRYRAARASLTCDISRSERDAALEAFRRGDLRILLSSRVLNEGLDVPDANVALIIIIIIIIIVGGGTLGEREHVQRIGRLLRPAPGKRAVVYEPRTARNQGESAH